MEKMPDAILIVSFGGPECHDDVMPFLENVTRGRGVPRERLLEVAEHYHHFDGKSPINAQNKSLIAALKTLLAEQGPQLPVYWGNRNWHPFLRDTFAQMKADGITRAFAFVTSAFSSYSGCRQYRENLAQAMADNTWTDLEVHKLRVFFNHPGFIEPMIANTKAALASLPAGVTKLIFTAHSIPLSMQPGERYVPQLREASRLVAEGCGIADWELVWQSRSGPPTQPWLEPDIGDYLRSLAGYRNACIVPIGFVSDHLEVLWDLDNEAAQIAQELGLGFARAATAGTDPRFVQMVRDLVVERRDAAATRPALGVLGASHDVCPADCCPAPQRPAARPAHSQPPGS
jgi:ferrochelatase